MKHSDRRAMILHPYPKREKDGEEFLEAREISIVIVQFEDGSRETFPFPDGTVSRRLKKQQLS